MADIKPSWITNKKSMWDAPWCLVKRRMDGTTLWTAVVKTWQADPAKDYARWMVKSWIGDQTGQDAERWDGGDEYCRLILQGELVEVMGRPPTHDEKLEWAVLERRAIASPDAFAEMGF